MSRRAPAIALGLLLALGAATPVLAHVGVESSEQEPGSTVAGVASVTLIFDEAIERKTSSFKLVGPDGSTIGTGVATGPRRMVLDGLMLQPGEHTVKWTAAGGDGHIERGRLVFTVVAAAQTEAPATDERAGTGTTPPSGRTPTPSASDGPAAVVQPVATPATTPAATASAVPSPAAASGADVLIPIVAGLAIVGLVGFLVLRRSRAV